MATPPDTQLLQKFYRQQCTEEETQRVLEWLQAEENEAAAAQVLMARWQALRREKITGQPNSHQLFERIQATLHDQPDVRRKPAVGWVLRVAAGLALLLIAGALLYGYRTVFRYQTLSTGYGQTRSFTLPDGSTVHLNGNSQLRYATRWGRNQSREVWLAGEAFFSVKHTQSHQPFLVHTGKDVDVEVLGTEFNVYTRRGEAQVVLARGKVKLHLPDQPGEAGRQLVMQPGELVRVAPAANQYEKKTVNPARYASWREHKLQLENTPLRELLTVLEEAHGLRVTVTDPALLEHRGTGTIPTDDPRVLLAVVADVFELKVSQQGQSVQLMPLP